MPEQTAKKIESSSSAADLKTCRGKLETAIEQFKPNLMMDIRVYLKQFKLPHLLEYTEEFYSELQITALKNARNYDPECSARAWLRQAAFFMVQHLSRDARKQPRITAVSEAALKFSFDGSVENASESELFDYLEQNCISKAWTKAMMKR